VLLSAACFLIAPTARAEDPLAPDAEARAKQLFDAALADAQKGNYKDACPKFRASYTINRKASTLFNLGACYEHNGQTASAWGAFSEAVGAARQAGHDDWSRQAAERVRLLELRVVKVTVVVPPEARVAGLTLQRDGAMLTASEWGLPTPIDPGKHVLSATAPGKASWETTFTINEGAPLVVRVPLLANERVVIERPKVVAPLQPPPGFWSPLRIVGFSTASAGVVALGVGTVVALVAKDRYDTSRQACPSTTCQDPGAISDNRSAFNLATGATVTLIAGTALTAAGASLFLLAPNRQQPASGLRATPSFQVRGHDAAPMLCLGGSF
jgi:hypothetical protein